MLVPVVIEDDQGIHFVGQLSERPHQGRHLVGIVLLAMVKLSEGVENQHPRLILLDGRGEPAERLRVVQPYRLL